MTESMIYDARDRAVEAGGAIGARLRKAWADYRLYRATVRELSQLTDRELSDLGIHRASIDGIARDSVYRG